MAIRIFERYFQKSFSLSIVEDLLIMIHIRTDDEYEQAMETVGTNPSYPIPTRPIQKPTIDKELIDVTIDPVSTTKTIPLVATQQSSHSTTIMKPAELPITITKVLSQQSPKQAISSSKNKNPTIKKSVDKQKHAYCLSCRKNERFVKRWKYYSLTTLYIILCVITMLSKSVIYEYFELTSARYNEFAQVHNWIYLNVVISTFLWQKERITSHWGYTIAYFMFALILAFIFACITHWCGLSSFIFDLVLAFIFAYNFGAVVFYICNKDLLCGNGTFESVPCTYLGCCVFPNNVGVN